MPLLHPRGETESRPEATPPLPHGRAAVPLRSLREKIQPAGSLEQPLSNGKLFFLCFALRWYLQKHTHTPKTRSSGSCSETYLETLDGQGTGPPGKACIVENQLASEAEARVALRSQESLCSAGGLWPREAARRQEGAALAARPGGGSQRPGFQELPCLSNEMALAAPNANQVLEHLRSNSRLTLLARLLSGWLRVCAKPHLSGVYTLGLIASPVCTLCRRSTSEDDSCGASQLSSD